MLAVATKTCGDSVALARQSRWSANQPQLLNAHTDGVHRGQAGHAGNRQRGVSAEQGTERWPHDALQPCRSPEVSGTTAAKQPCAPSSATRPESTHGLAHARTIGFDLSIVISANRWCLSAAVVLDNAALIAHPDHPGGSLDQDLNP